MIAEMLGKQLELLKEGRPKLSRVALFGNPANPNDAPQVRHAQDAARVLGIRLQLREARDLNEIGRALAAITSERAGAIVALTDTVLFDRRTRIAEEAGGAACRQCSRWVSWPRRGAFSPMDQALPMEVGGRPRMWAASSRARSQPSSRSS
jgi:putative ABC transport system substrate-binding protein